MRCVGGVCLAEFGGVAVSDEGEGAEVLLNSQNLLNRILKGWREFKEKLLVGIEWKRWITATTNACCAQVIGSARPGTTGVGIQVPESSKGHNNERK